MTFPPAVRTLQKRVGPVLALAVIAAIVAAPNAIGLSGGMHSEAPGFPGGEFDAYGCAASGCHGGHEFATGQDKVEVSIFDAEGQQVVSGKYEHDATYTIQINLTDEIAPEADNHAGFYLSATAGAFHAIDGTNVQVAAGGSEAAHTDASATSWTVEWTAPAEGAVAFEVLVNDVDGSGRPDEADAVYRKFFALTDSEGARLGAAAEEHEIHFGVSLQQYWIGLIAVAGMVFIMLGGYIYLKYVNPHNTGPKDR